MGTYWMLQINAVHLTTFSIDQLGYSWRYVNVQLCLWFTIYFYITLLIGLECKKTFEGGDGPSIIMIASCKRAEGPAGALSSTPAVVSRTTNETDCDWLFPDGWAHSCVGGRHVSRGVTYIVIILLICSWGQSLIGFWRDFHRHWERCE